jgi:TonB family protein
MLLAGPLALGQQRITPVKDFLQLSLGDTSKYVVRGVVTKVRSTVSGSFFLKDETGELLVYGLQDGSGQGRTFKLLDIVQGDTVTVCGRFTIYNGTTKEMKDGVLLSKSDGPDHNIPFEDRLKRKASFKGKAGADGIEAFKGWVQSHVKNPGGKGTVMVRFVIGRKGGVQEVQVVKGVSPSLNEEAVRVVQSAPKWKPAMGDDGPVRMTYTIPVVFE